MRLLLCSLLLFSLGLGFVDVDDHNSRFITRYNARQFQKIQQYLIEPGPKCYFAMQTSRIVAGPYWGQDVYNGIRDKLYAYYSNMTSIYCLVSYTDSPADLHTYNTCTVTFTSGDQLKFVVNIANFGNTSNGVPDNRYTAMSFSDPPLPPCNKKK